MFSPEMLEGESPLFIQDEGEQDAISKEHLKELIAAHLPLLSTLNDMDTGLIHVTLTEYEGLSHAFMDAWRLYKSVKGEKLLAEKASREKQRNSIPPHA